MYLLGIVLDTLLNSWLLSGAWGWLCVGGLQTSGPLCPPPSVSSVPLVSALSSLIKQGTCSPNNLPPQSPGTTPAFYQHHCFSLLPPLVLLHHGNTCTHTHTHTHASAPLPCACPICVQACHVSIHKGAGGNATVCRQYMMLSFCARLSPRLLTADPGGHWTQ